MVTDAQVRLLRRKLMEGKTQEAAGTAAGMSVRTARAWKTGPLPSHGKAPRAWRTRADPFAGVWASEVVPLLKGDVEGVLRATTILEELQARHPGEFVLGQARTLQRRVRDWRALYGPHKEVYFEQEHPPGREGAFDFTHCTELKVTILGEILAHLLFVLRLSASGWTWAEVAFGETFEALLSGVQNAVWAMGGVPHVLRHDNLSAATRELKRSAGRSLTRRFQEVVDHYGTSSTRIQPGRPEENGVAEKGNDFVKTALRQALVLRGSRDFESLESYKGFVRDVVERSRNRHVSGQLEEERRHLLPLPARRLPEYTEFQPKVRKWSTIRVAGRSYSVPSRLIGHEVTARQRPDVIEVLFKGQLVEKMPRLRGSAEVRIDYRHVIWSLVRKPGAFARYRYREELFPSLVFRRAYDALTLWRGERADIEYVRILHLAASTMESRVEAALEKLLASGARFDYAATKAIAQPERRSVPEIAIPKPDLQAYDRLLGGAG